MKFTETEIKDVYLIEPRVFEDERGYFMESYKDSIFSPQIGDVRFVQDNESRSRKGVIRALHFQRPPFAQAKLVRVVYGAVWDVVVDLRTSSATYGKYFGVELSDENKRMLWIPEGFAHGFLSLQDHTILNYKCTNCYHPEAEGGLIWNDPTLAIPWNVEQPIVSEKDQEFPLFVDFSSPFV